MAKERFEGQTDFLFFLAKMNLSQQNFFVDEECSRLMTVREMMETDGKLRGNDFPGPMPYTLEDLARTARNFVAAGMSPEKAFAKLVGNDAFLLVHALAVTIARAVEEKSKSAKAGI